MGEYDLTHIRRRDGIVMGVWKIKMKDEDGDWMGWVPVCEYVDILEGVYEYLRKRGDLDGPGALGGWGGLEGGEGVYLLLPWCQVE